MSAAKPYDDHRREGGTTLFEAELPAFAAIGRRHDELYKAYYDFTYRREHIDAERAFVSALEQARDRAAAETVAWGEVDRDLEARHGEKYRRLRLTVPPMFLNLAAASPAGVVPVLDMLIVGSKGALARMASASEATDDPAVREAAEWQPEPPPGLDLFASPILGDLLDRSKAGDPGLDRGIAGALRGLAGLLGPGNDPGPLPQQVADRIRAFGQPPPIQPFLEEQKQVVERLRQAHPEIAGAMQRQLDEMELLASDPAGFQAKMEAEQQAGAASGSGDAEEADAPRPPGRFRFDCGGVGSPTDHQRQLFDRLVERQHAIAPRVEEALRAMHAEMAECVDLADPREQVLFSDDARTSDVPLGYFRIERILLPESGDRVGIEFESIFGHEEHGCALVIEGDGVAEFGHTEVLFLLEDDGDGDEYDDVDEEDIEEDD